METIAVYWEERIKVYGITPKNGLSLATLQFPYCDLVHLAAWARTLEQKINRFELITCQGSEEGGELHLLLESRHLENLEMSLQGDKFLEESVDLSLLHPVDLLYLHGPHFQDRYGILDAALQALRNHDIEIIGSGCAGTSMYLILPDGIGPTGHKVLTDTFLIPKSG